MSGSRSDGEVLVETKLGAPGTHFDGLGASILYTGVPSILSILIQLSLNMRHRTRGLQLQRHSRKMIHMQTLQTSSR